jgi:hypothetical protein
MGQRDYEYLCAKQTLTLLCAKEYVSTPVDKKSVIILWAKAFISIIVQNRL